MWWNIFKSVLAGEVLIATTIVGIVYAVAYLVNAAISRAVI